MCITFSVIVAIISFQILVVLLQDRFHVCVGRRFNIAGSALSTATLVYQFIVLGACTTLLTASLATWTMFAVKGEIANSTQFLTQVLFPSLTRSFNSLHVRRILLVSGSFGFRWNTDYSLSVEKGVHHFYSST